MTHAHRTRRLVVAAVFTSLVALAAAACVPLGNPASRQRPVATRVFDNSDPAVLVAGSRTYLFGSTNNKKVPVREVTTYNGSLAASKTHWDSVSSPPAEHDAMPTKPDWVRPTLSGGRWEIWAPSVVRIGDTYYLYFSGRRVGATSAHDDDQCIGRASSKNPMGPYSPGPTPLYCGLAPDRGANPWGRGALDPEVFRAPDGKLYLLVALSRTEDNIGVVPLAADGRVPGGVNARPTTLVRQHLPWHDGRDNSTLGSGAFLENPSMVYEPKTKTYLLFYSAGQWYTANYLTGFARCASPTGPCTAASTPFLIGGNGRSAPGGLTAFRSAGGDLRVAYSTWTAGSENASDRDGGRLSRHGHWSRLVVTDTTDAGRQTVRLAE